jgi:hemerythrin-like domain-containing protein
MATMLVQIGQRTQHEDLVDLLAECHARIRRFLSLAASLADDRATPENEARSVAGQIRRYFSSAFPQHVADEDELVTPRLTGTNARLDQVLAQLHDDHVHHADAIAHLVDICADIERDPRTVRAGELRSAAERLIQQLEPHLCVEERELFPAVRALPAEIQTAIRAAMRQRREAAL